jgi:hypothetical protein
VNLRLKRYGKLVDAPDEWQKRELLSLLHRLEKLESPNGEAVLRRLPSVETQAERDAVAIEMSERLSVLEAQLEDGGRWNYD